MTLIGKQQAGGALGYYWDEDDSVLDVPDETARALLRVQAAGYYEVQPVENAEVEPVKTVAEVASLAPPETTIAHDLTEALGVASPTTKRSTRE